MYVKGECMCVREPEWIMSCTAPHKGMWITHTTLLLREQNIWMLIWRLEGYQSRWPTEVHVMTWLMQRGQVSLHCIPQKSHCQSCMLLFAVCSYTNFWYRWLWRVSINICYVYDAKILTVNKKARQVYLYSTIQQQGDSKCFTETLKQ